MESPLATGQFLQLALLVGLPVHAALVVLATRVVRFKLRLEWLWGLALVPVWLAASLALQVGIWAVLPDLPESMFMLLGFVNLPALLGAGLLLAVLLTAFPRRQRGAVA
ncbi:MAG: hypothetical protein JNN30_17740 [Rhodanobacteraceae bacterium]|nr:hypothetical protein [Rhodanobacteraceae bacterium]